MYRGKDVHNGFWWGNLSETDHFENLSENGMIISGRVLKMRDGEARTGMIWLRTGTRGGIL
jgi:hypothetical protein